MDELNQILEQITESYVISNSKKISQSHIQACLDYQSEISSKVKNEKLLFQYEREIKLILALIEDYQTGTYKEVSAESIGIMVFSLLYVLSDNDLIPDDIPVWGLKDDAAVLEICMKLIRKDIMGYDDWLFKFGQY
ncbi:MAG: ykvA [Ignavibacteria bacterium]|nr:ykvA [Ignavibacteria bacterium]